MSVLFTSFLAPRWLCHLQLLLITFANSLDPYQNRQNVFDTLKVFLKEFLEKVDFEKKSADDNKRMNKLPSMQRVKLFASMGRINYIKCAIHCTKLQTSILKDANA